MSAVEKIEERLASLEAEMAAVKDDIKKDKQPWWEAIYGTFADDPHYEAAMKFGRAYRDSTKPKTRCLDRQRL